MYYFVTFWCYNSDIVESNALRSTFRVGSGDIGFFGSSDEGYVIRIPIPGTEEAEQVKITSRKGMARVGLVIFFVVFILYQLIAGGFILNEILQATYIASHYYGWFIAAIVILGVIFVGYVIYALSSYTGLMDQASATGEVLATGRTSSNVCNFARPIMTLLLIAFMTMFSYGTIYSRFHNSDHNIPNTQDPTIELNSLYYGCLLVILGFLFISVFFVAKDGMMSIFNTNFVYNPKTASAFMRVAGAEGTASHASRAAPTSASEY